MTIRFVNITDFDRLKSLWSPWRDEESAGPPKIVAKRRQIDAATRNAVLFMQRLRVVDEGMINDIVRMKLELDGLYTEWLVDEGVAEWGEPVSRRRQIQMQ